MGPGRTRDCGRCGDRSSQGFNTEATHNVEVLCLVAMITHGTRWLRPSDYSRANLVADVARIGAVSGRLMSAVWSKAPMALLHG